MAEKIPTPRFLKTHLALSLLPPRLLDVAKAVYVARDPRDVAVSYYHHDKLFSFMGFTGDFKQLWECFVESRRKSGEWREYVDEEMSAQAQRWIDDNLRGTDLRFPKSQKYYGHF